MSQTTVSAGGQAFGLPGQPADTMKGRDIVSGFQGETGLQMPFGYALRQNPGVADSYLLATGFSSSAGPIVGLNVYSLAHNRAGTVDSAGNYTGDMGASGLLYKSSLQVARQGRYIVPVEANVLVNDRAYVRGIATGSFSAGIWAGSGYGASYHIDCTAQGVFRSGTYTAADGVTKVAVLEVDFTNKGA